MSGHGTPAGEQGKRCAICRQQRSYGVACWAWHRFCQCELNPVALIAWIDALPQTDEVKRIRGYVVAVTGMDERAALEAVKAQA